MDDIKRTKYVAGSIANWPAIKLADYMQQLRSKPVIPEPFLVEWHYGMDCTQALTAAMEDALLSGMGAVQMIYDPVEMLVAYGRVDIQDFIDAVELPTWPPVLATRTLTPNAERNRKVFTDTYAGRKCQCTASWTCDMCRHPGNPKIQDENPFCWDITPDPVSDVVDATVYRKKVSEW